MAARLPTAVKEQILTFPEYRMGTHKVALFMKDGSVVDNVIVAWSDEVVRVGGVDGCPINVDEVVGAEDRSR
jgi:hypothetical protein